ncbi:hypothetical protein GA0061105_10137 [Rhizobium aethiopicum]|uniref:Uncharacterized protein n=1 Tax=Rhizobium aethiopicum TaxID=1138170 RepID=A0A1C3XVG0_9HYPH|nr:MULTISPECIES: hypothetical protein [Rhizobium]SCB56209.1 hypothetical protein GA0061105_10137 [Rhizobium aethiopicum]
MRNIIRAAVKAALSISEGYALKYFILYALVCSAVGIVLLVVIHQIAPFQMERPSDQTAFEPAEQPDDLVVRSTREPATSGQQPTREPGVRTDQWDLRPTGEPTVRKGGRVGTPAQ